MDESSISRERIAMIPVGPEGMGLVQAVESGYITGGEPLEYFNGLRKSARKENSTVYSRLPPDGLMKTLITTLQVTDARGQRTVHWEQPRSLTVMEARRAQGYRDDEVLIGPPRRQMKIVGNSVDRSVSLAIGMALRASWVTSIQPTAASDGTSLPSRSRSSLELNGTRGLPLPTGSSATMSDAASSDASSGAERSTLASTTTSQGSGSSGHGASPRVKLSDAQVDDIRSNGFKAIMRMLGSSPRNDTSKL